MSAKFAALFEDEDDIFSGTPASRYWDINKQVSEDLMHDDFDQIVERIAVMEALLAQTHEYESLDQIIKNYVVMNPSEVEELKKSVYMELGGKLIYRISD